MKLLIKEYLASLKERGELDALLPDLLSEMGWDVYSRPAVGVRQLGVDMAACGKDDDGQKKVFLFSLKAGNLKRAEWDGSVQALRSSLNEIVDSYIHQRIPQKYADLPIVICICLGGDIDQSVEGDIRAYTAATAKKHGVAFQEWNGDKLANLLLSGALREQVLPQKSRALFRKSVAMLDEPAASFSYFSQLLHQLGEDVKPTPKARLSLARRVSICLWILFVWSRESGNVESPYLASELAILHVWKLMVPHLDKKGATADQMRRAIDSLAKLHLQIAIHFAESKIFPHCGSLHAVSSAVRSPAAVDINLRVFDLLGRLSMLGLWTHYIRESALRSGKTEDAKGFTEQVSRCCKAIIDLINNNPVLYTPIKDNHAIEVNLTALFLVGQQKAQFVRMWIGQLIKAAIYGFRTGRQYPCIYRDYRELAVHPRGGTEYRKEATAASVLYPTLAAWATILQETDALNALASFAKDDLDHCAMQLWFPSSDSEERFYTNSDLHGVTLTDLKITSDGAALERLVGEEIRRNTGFDSLSAMRADVWPIVLLACRHHRLPVPPNFWQAVSGDYGQLPSAPAVAAQ